MKFNNDLSFNENGDLEIAIPTREAVIEAIRERFRAAMELGIDRSQPIGIVEKVNEDGSVWVRLGAPASAVAQTTMITPPVLTLPVVGDRVKRVYRECVIYGIAEKIDYFSRAIAIRVDNIEGVSSTLVGETRTIPLKDWYSDPVVFDKYGRCGIFPADFDSMAGASTPPEPAEPEEPVPSCTNCATCDEPFPYAPMPANRPDGRRDCSRCKMMNGVFK